MSVSEVFSQPFFYLNIFMYNLLYYYSLAGWPFPLIPILSLFAWGASYRHDTRDLQHGNAANTPKKKGRDQSYAYYLKKEELMGIH